MSKKHRVFTREFKLEICNQVELRIKTQAQICREHRLGSNLVGRWLAEYRADPKGCFPGSRTNYPQATSDAERIKQLEQALGRVTLENQILQKVITLMWSWLEPTPFKAKLLAERQVKLWKKR